jgi:hypothetical protein
MGISLKHRLQSSICNTDPVVLREVRYNRDDNILTRPLHLRDEAWSSESEMGVTMVASWVGDGGKSVDEAKDPEGESKRTLMLREWGRVVFEG